MILENIHGFARNQAETIDKPLYSDQRSDRANKSDYKDIYPLLYELQTE
jgi:hypothetical protein